MFDHRTSIIKYLDTEATKREARTDDADARRQALTYRVIESNLRAGLDLPAGFEADAA